MRSIPWTYTEAATDLGTDIRTVSGLVRALGITPKRVPHNGNGKGLDADDMAALREALARGRERAEAAASA